MEKGPRWVRTQRGLLILLTTVVALPAITLVFLGVRLLQQDRALERQRRAEILQDASDRAVNALERELASLRMRLADRSWPAANALPGSLHVLITRDDVRVEPRTAIAYFPDASNEREPPVDPFRALESAELEAQDFSKALEIGRRLAASSDPAVQAGALMREARILRKMGRAGEALALYGKLAQYSGLSINGLPVDLQARKTRCVLLSEQSRTAELQREAAAISADLAAGRWRLDRASYEYVGGLLDGWLGAGRGRQTDREIFAAAVGWLQQQWTGSSDGALRASGAHVLADPTPVTVVWASTGDRVAALVAAPAYLEREWLVRAQQAAGPVQVSLVAAADSRASRASTASDTLTSRRTAADTGLPWTVMISLSGQVDAAQFEGRRRTLFAALAAVLVLVAAGGYVIVRARNREMTLARLQSDFVTAVSHEFRTPLTVLRQFNALLDEPGDLTADARRRYYEAQRRATERLNRLVESLLDFGRMEARKRSYALERLDAGLLVRDVVEEFRDEIDSRGMTVRCSAEPGEHLVDADPEALARAVWNLVDNAVKYSGDSREVDVTVGRNIDGVSIAVRDRGIGIPPGERARIFQKFTRGAAAASSRIKGTGIGLAMVHHIVSGHRGTLDVDSVEHQGSTFTIVLPAGGLPEGGHHVPMTTPVGGVRL